MPPLSDETPLPLNTQLTLESYVSPVAQAQKLLNSYSRQAQSSQSKRQEKGGGFMRL